MVNKATTKCGGSWDVMCYHGHSFQAHVETAKELVGMLEVTAELAKELGLCSSCWTSPFAFGFCPGGDVQKAG